MDERGGCLLGKPVKKEGEGGQGLKAMAQRLEVRLELSAEGRKEAFASRSHLGNLDALPGKHSHRLRTPSLDAFLALLQAGRVLQPSQQSRDARAK